MFDAVRLLQALRGAGAGEGHYANGVAAHALHVKHEDFVHWRDARGLQLQRKPSGKVRINPRFFRRCAASNYRVQASGD